MSINLAALDTRHCKTTMFTFIQILVIISTLTASALARRYPSWYCYDENFLGTWRDRGATHHCCDVYEDEGTPGVKYTGSLRCYCNDPQSQIDWDTWDTCCVGQGTEGGGYD